MTTWFEADSWAAFLAAFGTARSAGVDVYPTGGNTAAVPDDTDPELLAALAGHAGVAVFTDQPAAAAGQAPPRPAKTRARTPNGGP